MTAPLPTPALSLMADLCNALMRLYIRRALPLIAAQQTALDEARNRNYRLRTAADFRATEAAGHIDRTGLDA